MKVRFGSRAALVLALAMVACGPAQAPQVAGGADQPLNAASPVDALNVANANFGGVPLDQLYGGEELKNAKYATLYKQFGAPNQLVPNPDAVYVNQTPSRDTVRVQPDSLTFPAGDRWVLGRRPGDVLACDQSCNNTPFLRKVVSVQQQGDLIVVKTVQGAINDIVKDGWIHLQIPVGLTITSTGAPDSPAQVINHTEWGFSYSGSKTIPINFPQLNLARDVSVGPESPMGGSTSVSGSVGIELKDTLSGSVTFDLAVSGFSIKDFSAELKLKNSFDGALELAVQRAFTYKTHIESIDIPAGTYVLPCGPILIPIDISIPIDADLTAEADGKVAIKGSYQKENEFETGFKYTDSGGFSGINPAGDPSPGKVQFSGSGEAGFKVALDFETGIEFKLFKVAGPVVKIDMKPGIEGSLKTEHNFTTGECKATLQADFFIDFTCGGKAVLKIKLGPINIDKEFGDFEFSIYKYTVPNPPWSKDISKLICPAEPDGGAAECKCKDGSKCPGADASSCPSSPSCTCSDGTVCPNGDSSQCATCKCPNGSNCPAGGVSACSGGADGGGSGCAGANLQTDSKNCGACGNNCWTQTGDPNSTCQAGACTCTCSDGSQCPGTTQDSCCQPGVSDTSSDPYNCGACGHACSPGLACVNGQCTCDSSNATCV